MKTKEKELSIEQQTIADCPILFRMIGQPLTESIISFGFECGKGWHRAISDACRQLEMLNSEYYKKYRVRIQMDQIKEKFGECRAYYSISVDPNAFVVWLANKFNSVYNYLNAYKRFDYALTKVVDIEPFDYDETNEISEELYNEKVDPNYKGIKCSNVDFIKKDGKFFEVRHLRNIGKSHNAPTKNKLLWHIKEFAYKTYANLLYSSKKKDTAMVRNCIVLMECSASKIIRHLENECENLCEECGSRIGTQWSPACRTTGWITFICDKCAEKRNDTYVKNGELWQGTKMLKSKEEMNAKYEKL